MSGTFPIGQRFSDDIEAIEVHLDGRQSQIHTSMPATIVSYDTKTMTAVVQPALQGFQTKDDGSRLPLTLTTISDVPVHFPGGGGHILTFPVQAGDDCWLVFSERSIDNWFQHGGTQQPSDWRMHDINDPVCYVGVRSQPKVPGGTGSSRDNSGAPVSATTVQLRSDDGKTLVNLDGMNNALGLVCGNTVITVDGKTDAVTINAATITFNGDLHVNGQVWAEYNSNPVSVQSHVHKNANAGNPPQVGT